MTEQLYAYQQMVQQALQTGKNVILRAPTGAGKTYAALYPFLASLRTDGKLPSKCLYAVPMRILANQFVESYGDQIVECDVLPPNQRDRAPRVSIQTGEQPLDPRLEATLTFATIDQVLSSFLMSPYALSEQQANLNAGAVLASYLVFDEFHLFEPNSTLPTTLEMLKMLRNCTPFLLMTATFSTSMLHSLAEQLEATVIDAKDEAAQLPSQQKERSYYTSDVPLTAEAILKHHTERTLVVCNTIERAQALFQATRAQASNAEVLLLHSRFLSADRNAIEARIRNAFAKGNRQGSYIVIATQAIEVGLDITCSVLHTELAPANAIVQRAGRCARYGGERGSVFIYRHAIQNGEVIDLLEKNMPYADQSEVIVRTWETFRQRQGRYHYTDELDALSEAHAEQDRRIVERLSASSFDHITRMRQTMHDGQHVAELIRDSHQVRLVIHAQPETLLNNGSSPYALETFSLHPDVLERCAQQWMSAALPEEPPFRLKKLSASDSSEESSALQYAWQRVDAARGVSAMPIVVVHPALASYDSALGLLLHTGGTWQTPAASQATASRDVEHIGYRLETYADHIKRVYAQLRDVVWAELAAVAARLEALFGWQQGSLFKAAQLVILLHDAGKLNTHWQEYVQDWQAYIGAPADAAQIYAHTDYTSAHAAQKKTFARRAPPHAAEGALLSAKILAAQFGKSPLFYAAFSAIARHHHARAKTARVNNFKLHTRAAQITQQLFDQLAPELTNGSLALMGEEELRQCAVIETMLVNPMNSEHHEAYFAYTLLARALRRADQRGTRLGTI